MLPPLRAGATTIARGWVWPARRSERSDDGRVLLRRWSRSSRRSKQAGRLRQRRLPRHAQPAPRHAVHDASRRARRTWAAPSSPIRKGQPVLLGQVADRRRPAIRRTSARASSTTSPACSSSSRSIPWANTLEVTRDVEKALETLRPEPARRRDHHAASSARPRSSSWPWATCSIAMILGCILVALILIAFLFEWRTAVISLTAIPLSIVGRGAGPEPSCGGTLNTMVLAGLAIAIGEVVDDAIIDVENIVRRLRQNRAAGRSRCRRSASCWSVAGSAQRRRLRQLHRRLRVPADLLPGRRGRVVLPAAGAGLHPGGPGVAAGGPDGDAGPVR